LACHYGSFFEITLLFGACDLAQTLL